MKAFLLDTLDRSIIEIDIAGNELEIRALILNGRPDPMSVSPGNHENPNESIWRDEILSADDGGVTIMLWWVCPDVRLPDEDYSEVYAYDDHQQRRCYAHFIGTALVLGEKTNGDFTDANLTLQELTSMVEWNLPKVHADL